MIVIIDYQMGNLRSVQKALEHVGHEAIITDDPVEVSRADKIILPGVGAFEDAIAELQVRCLVGPIKEAIADEKPFLGICLGLQLLFDVSHENGRHQGLGVLPGEVVQFKGSADLKVPHMGWNGLQFRRRVPLLEGIADGSHFYFVHSYYVKPRDESLVATETEYGSPFCSMICCGNLFATQFHPEKSQTDGLQLLKNFAELRSISTH
ncbi:MAG: imidazole glycerol phosphate synthase subunit HisH [Pirellulales bacterium]|nr:imidazole glycerol phosphate synthase subunit HisH [Pirellulales bacterium]